MSGSEGGAETSDPGDYAGWVGRVLDGRYRIEGLLGEGGMGAVFVGEHLKLMKKVAIKVIHPEFAGDGDVAERFAREAVAAGQMEHPHVASATDYGTLPEGGAYLVMQYVRGSALRDVLDEEGATGWVRCCEIGAQVADALAAAHQKGYVHRDLKPDNVMLEPRDDGSHLVKVLDFGIARVASEKAVGAGGRALTRIGTVIGTPGYMAPEQALGEPVDYRADLYSLGLLLHEMVTGEAVFGGSELTAIVTRQLTEVPPRLTSLIEGVPNELDELVARLLERDKDHRPQGASEVREILRSLLLGATLHAVASGEHEIPKLATTALGNTAEREATPLGVPITRRANAMTPPPGAAAKLAAPSAARITAPTPLRRAGAVATAKTALALDAVKQQVQKTGAPLPLIGAGCAALGLVGVLAIVGISMLFGGDDEEPVSTGDEPTAVVAPEEPPEPAPEPIAALGEPLRVPIPPALGQAMADVLLSEQRSVRRQAARQILEHQPQASVPPFLLGVAELEDTSSCRRKRDALARLADIGDPRALPALDRLDAEPRNGCQRMFRRFDCYQCLREQLGNSLATLRARVGT